MANKPKFFNYDLERNVFNLNMRNRKNEILILFSQVLSTFFRFSIRAFCLFTIFPPHPTIPTHYKYCLLSTNLKLQTIYL